MRPMVALIVVLLAVLNSSHATAQDKPKAQLKIALRLRATRECELTTPAALALYDTYAAVIPEGQAEEWYSPELSKSDSLVLPPSSDKNVIKAARKSGFQAIIVNSPLVTAAEVTQVGNSTAGCPTPENALTSADAARQQRRKEVQSHMYSLTDRGVISPKPLTQENPPQPVEAGDRQPKPKVTHGTVMLAMLIGIDGVVHDVKVIVPLDPALDAKAIEAIKRERFVPGRKLGLPVPVRIDTEVNFKLD